MSQQNKGREGWVKYGKAMMVLSGVNCVALACYMPSGEAGLFLRLWVASFGLLNVWFAFSQRSRSD